MFILFFENSTRILQNFTAYIENWYLANVNRRDDIRILNEFLLEKRWGYNSSEIQSEFQSEKCMDSPIVLFYIAKSCFIYILDSSNSSSFTFLTSKLASSFRSNWISMWTGNSNGSWADKHSCHFSTAKEISVKATFFFM